MKQNEMAVIMNGVGKKYRYGQIGAGTLQGDLKEWYQRKKNARNQERADTEDAPYQIGETFYALKDIDLTIKQGETLGIIGKNGAGKSTLLKLLSRITAPSEGNIKIYGRVASMLEVGTGFDGELTGRENIYLNGAILGMKRAEITKKIEDIITFSEVGDFIDTPVKRYSSGMYVKLGFAVAAHLDSEIMIMDEVLAVGDMAFQHKCLDRMKAAAKQEGKTVLYVSHNMHTIRRLCDRCIVLDKGKLLFDGDVDTATAIYLGAEDIQQIRYEFDADYRPYDKNIRLNKRFNMDVLEVLNTSVPEYEEGEVPCLRLTCTSEQYFPKVGFRFELWYQDGTKTGTMLSGNTAEIKEGKNVLELRPDLTHLTPGQYRADLVAYLYDSDGNEDILDGVYPGFAFTIRNSLNERHYLDWHHQYWGHIRLHDMQVARLPYLEREIDGQ